MREEKFDGIAYLSF